MKYRPWHSYFLKTFWPPLLGLSLLLISSCGLQNTDYIFETEKSILKGQDALAACNSIRLPRDIDFSGSFLFKFLNCVSEKDSEGNDKFSATHLMVNTLGEEGLDNLTKILLFQDSKKDSENNTKSYPMLRLLRIFIERGLFHGTETTPDPSLKEERLFDLQSLLVEFYPKPLFRFLNNLNNDNKSQEFINHFQDLSKSDFPNYVSSYLNLGLNDANWQGGQYQLITNFFNSEELITPIEKMLEIENGYHLTENSKKGCLTSWLTPAVLKEEENCNVENSLKSSNGVAIYKSKFLQNISSEQKRDLSAAIGEFLKGILNADNFSLNLEKWNKALKQTLTNQIAPLKHYLSVADFLTTHGPNETPPKVSDLEEIISAIEEIVGQSGPQGILSLNVKIGSAKLHEYVENKLIEGGTISSCPGIELPGLKEGRGPNEFEFIFSKYLKKNESCAYSLPPLYALTLDYISKKLNITFPCSTEESDSCLDDNTLKRLSNILNTTSDETRVSNENKSEDDEEISPAELKYFTLEALTFIIEKQKANASTLYELNLAPLEYSVDSLLDLRDTIKDENNLNTQYLARLDQSALVPTPHFIEEVLALYLREAKSYLASWQGIYSDHYYREQKARVLIQGLNQDGYYERMAHEVLKINNIPDVLLAKIAKKDFKKLEAVLARWQMPESFFKNHRLDLYEEETPWYTLGQEKRSVELIYKKIGNDFVYQRPELNRRSLFAGDIFSKDTWRIEKNIAEDIGLSKDISKATTDIFLKWFQTDYYNYIANEFSWTDFAHQANLSPPKIKLKKVIQSSPYSLQEKRAMAFFISQNFLLASDYLPANDESCSIEKVINKRRPDIRANFMSLPAEDSQYWDVFIRHFPEQLSSENNFIEETISASLGVFEEEIWKQIAWAKLPVDKRGQRELRGLSGNAKKIVEELSTLQLLTVNSVGKFVPFVGVDKECEKNQGINYTCPLTFKDQGSNGPNPTKAFTNLRKYLYERTLSYFCPFIVKDGPFNEQTSERIRNELKIKVRDEETYTFCQKIWDNHNLVTKELDGVSKKALPFKHFQEFFNLFFEMGKNPKIPDQYSKAIASIKFNKNLADGLPTSDKIRQWLNSPQEKSEEINEYLTKVISDHKGFYTKNPGMLNAKLYFMGSVLRHVSENYDHALWRIGVDLNATEDLKGGSTQRFLEEMLIPLYRNYKNPNAPLLHFVHDLIVKLNEEENKKIRDSLLYSISFPQDVETYPTFSKTLPLFLNHIYFKNGQERLWTLPALQLARPFLYQENFRTLSNLTENFGPNQIINFTDAVFKGVSQFTTSNFDTVIKLLAQTLNENALRLNAKDGFFIDSYKNNFITMMGSPYIKNNTDAMNYLAKSLIKPYRNLANDKTSSFDMSFPLLTTFFLDHCADLLSLYQNRTVKINDELKNIIYNLINPMKNGKNEKGSQALANLLKNDELPAWDYIHNFIFSQQNQKSYLGLMSKMSTLKNEQLVNIMNETTDLLPKSYNILNYTIQRIRWRADLPTDAKMALVGLSRVATEGNEIWSKQLQSALIWLQNERNLQESNHILTR